MLGGYDIRCSFETTVNRTSVGLKYHAKHGHLCVNEFHEYSHNYFCQLKHHSNVIRGIGIEDLETMEQIFGATNCLASIMCYMFPYRRLLYIETYLQQWDDNKYANLVTFILHNYQQALKIIEEGERTLEETTCSQDITHAQLNECEKGETTFFVSLEKKPNYDVHAVVYVELLQELQDLDVVQSSANAQFHASILANYMFVPEQVDLTD